MKKHQSGGLLVGVSGIRGVVGKTLTPEMACRLGACFAKQVAPGPVLLGRDPRPSGEVLLRAVAVGVAGSVVDVSVAAGAVSVGRGVAVGVGVWVAVSVGVGTAVLVAVAVSDGRAVAVASG